MDEQIGVLHTVVYYWKINVNEILIWHEWVSEMLCWEKQDSKEYGVYDFIHMILEIWTRNQSSGFLGRGNRSEKLNAKRNKRNSWGDRSVLYLAVPQIHVYLTDRCQSFCLFILLMGGGGKNTEVVCYSLLQQTMFCRALTRRDMPFSCST